ncbi:MAG: hypothetical protein K2O00_07580 [Muribaculaceae bacterium]|nr:hypothetical protein [Muribaculaceae bacterium]
MKRFYLIILLAVLVNSAIAQTITVKHGETNDSFKISEIDCITHEIQGENLVRIAWHNGSVISESTVSVGDEIVYEKAKPTIVGIWDVEEKYEYRRFPNAPWETRTRSYIVEFKEDGTFTKSDTSFERSSWSYNSTTGSFGAKGFTIATGSQLSWDKFNGNADNKDNPMKITGVRYEGNVNSVANVEEKKGDFEMTRRI